MKSSETTQVTGAVHAVMRRLFKPIAKLALAHGVTFPMLSELMKQVLVDVAETDFQLEGKATNDSRVSVVSGVHRKDVKRLRNAEVEVSEAPKGISIGSRLVNIWMTEKRWRTRNGRPAVLVKSDMGDGKPNFEELALFVSTDVAPRAILDELQRLGVVELSEDSRVRLNAEGFIPREGFEEKLYYLDRAGYGHLMAAVHNVQGEEPAFFDRIVHYDTIPAASVDKLKKLVEEEGMEVLKKVNTASRRVSRPDTKNPQRLTVGLYLYTEPVNNSADKN